MDYTVEVRAASSRQVLEDRLRAVTAAGPFRVCDLAPVVGGWAFRLRPARRGMAVGFAKVAELLVLLARDFEVQAVGRSASRTPASSL